MKKRDNSGSTMVSVIVAFMILMVGIAVFTNVIYLVFDLTVEAEDTRARVDAAMEAYYTGSLEDEKVITDDIWLKDQGEESGFTVSGKVYQGTYQGFGMYYFGE